MSNYSDSHFKEDDKNSSWYKSLALVAPGSKVLDVGCSSGNFGEVLKSKKNCIVHGVELDPDDAQSAAQKLDKVFTLNVETDDLSNLDQDYDIINFGDVIEHLFFPAATLQRLKSHLKPDGLILFSIPNMAYLVIRLLLLEGDFEYTETGLLDKTHVHFFNFQEIERIFNTAGYEISSIDFVAKDYPNGLIDERLNRLGLSAKPEFYKLMHQPEAVAFQYVGTAKIASSPKSLEPLAKFGPVDYFDAYHTKVVKQLEGEVYKLLEENKSLVSRIEEFKRSPHKVILRKFTKRLKKLLSR